jgi:hypothetical protein
MISGLEHGSYTRKLIIQVLYKADGILTNQLQDMLVYVIDGKLCL